MPRPQRPWFRFYVEAIYDRKLRRLTPAQRWLWVVVLAAARQSKQPGVLVDVDTVDLADMAAMPERDVKKALPMFEQSEMVHRDGDWWAVTNWNDRQYESDTSSLRMAKHRHNDVTTLSQRPSQ